MVICFMDKKEHPLVRLVRLKRNAVKSGMGKEEIDKIQRSISRCAGSLMDEGRAAARKKRIAITKMSKIYLKHFLKPNHT